MLEQFTEDAELDLLVREVSSRVVAGYAWRAQPSHQAGQMRFELRDGRIARLLVTFEKR